MTLITLLKLPPFPAIQKDPSRLHVVLLTIVYLLIDISFRVFVVPVFNHMNFFFDFSLPNLLTSLLLFGLTMLMMVRLKTSPFLHTTSIIFIVFLLIPNLILFQYMHTHPLISVASFLFIGLLRINLTIPLVQRIPTIPRRYTPWVLLILGLIFLIPIIYSYGINPHHGLSYSDTKAIYTMRQALKGQLSVFGAYGFGQLAKAILPAIILFGLIHRKYLFATAGLLATAYLFMVYPHKTYLVALLPIIFFALYRDYNTKSTLFLILLILALAGFRLLSHYGVILPESLLVRRSLLTQAFLTDAYFCYFEHHPLYLSHSALKYWLEYPYLLTPPYLIGVEYFGSPVMSCNTGFIGDGYMNFGYPGVFLYMAATAFLFHLINNLKLNHAYYGLTFLIIFQILNSALVTLMLTHGLFLLLLVMFFLFNKSDQPSDLFTKKG